MELKTNTNFAEMAGTLRGAQRIALVSHVRPDGDAAGCLGAGHSMQSDRCLTRGLRTIDLHHPTAWEATETKRDIKRDRAGRDHLKRVEGFLDERQVTEWRNDGCRPRRRPRPFSSPGLRPPRFALEVI